MRFTLDVRVGRSPWARDAVLSVKRRCSPDRENSVSRVGEQHHFRFAWGPFLPLFDCHVVGASAGADAERLSAVLACRVGQTFVSHKLLWAVNFRDSCESKHVRKYGHEGNGLKGPKTLMMVRQQRIFADFLMRKPICEGHSRMSRAHECWVQNPAWATARTAQGEARGYASHKSLSAAK